MEFIKEILASGPQCLLNAIGITEGGVDLIK